MIYFKKNKIWLAVITFLQAVASSTSLVWDGGKCPENSWSVKVVILKDLGLRYVPPRLAECFPNAEYVDLSQNNIRSFSPNEFRNMTRLRILDLSSNPLEVICLQHSNINHLILNDIVIPNKVVDPDCLDLPSLKQLDIQFSNIQLVFSTFHSTMPETSTSHGLMLLPNQFCVLLLAVLVMIILN